MLFFRYIDTLVQLSAVDGTQHGKLIANQMLDVTIRVKAVRKYAVPTFASLLGRQSLITSLSEKHTSCEVLFASAWVAGEFNEYVLCFFILLSFLYSSLSLV